jgi:hypothetical protein
MRFLALICLLSLLASCHSDSVNTKEVREKLDSRTLFHITDVQLIEGADRLGQRVARQLDSAQRIASGKEMDSLSCVAALAPILKALSNEEIKVERIAYLNWHPKKDLPKIIEVLEAIKYTHSQGQSVPANLQKDGQGGYQYTAGLVVSSAECLACHKSWKVNEEVGIWNLRFSSRPAVKEASKGMKGMK